ncbi:MAG: uridine diphosphate-N-acetylglucosamine-binding protein YvcK [Pyrinomonadaceae bacterium]|nr:uridine diphosphate-N-acetylglucosamine-binding protein YvcK [Pyrinomonadaceae bacterium]
MKHHLFSDSSDGLRFVAIGGGNGLSTLLSGLKRFVHARDTEPVWLDDLSAIVAVSDDGGSSGRLREELQMLPPGDIRNCMVALSEDSQLLSKLFKHRFRGDGDLGGHIFGNLFLAALSEITGDFAEAVKLSSEILASKGHIYPATVADVRLAAELNDGSTVKGETNISTVGHDIKRLYLEPSDCKPMPEALAAIEAANVITVGPGSLFTSLLPPILVEGVADAIAASPATKVYVCNLMTQPGETDGFTARHHLEVVREYAPQIEFDYVIVNDHFISGGQAEKYAGEGAEQIGVHGSISPETIEGAEIVYGNLLDEGEMVRHHPEKLAQVLLLCALEPRKELIKNDQLRITIAESAP